MANFLAEMEMYHGDDESRDMLVRRQAKVTESAPAFFAKIVEHELVKHRSADNLKELTPPTHVELRFSMSANTNGKLITVYTEDRPPGDVRSHVLSLIEDFVAVLSGSPHASATRD